MEEFKKFKSFKAYQGQELEYDGQRMEWEDEYEDEDEDGPVESDYMPKSALKRLKAQQEESEERESVQDREVLVEELTEWEIEDKQDSFIGISILVGFVLMAINNLMKLGQL